MYIEHDFLTGTLSGRSAKRLHCDKKSGHLDCPDTILLHYTGGGNAMSSAHYLARADTDVSAHLVISRDGGIIQILPFDTMAWHAGESEYEGRTNLNRYSIGIEVDNAGELHRRNGKFYSWFNKEYMPDEVYTDCVNGRACYWHNYTMQQFETLLHVCRLLISEYPIRQVLRHSDVTTRKLDPGPAFPFEEFKERLRKGGMK